MHNKRDLSAEKVASRLLGEDSPLLISYGRAALFVYAENPIYSAEDIAMMISPDEARGRVRAASSSEVDAAKIPVWYDSTLVAYAFNDDLKTSAAVDALSPDEGLACIGVNMNPSYHAARIKNAGWPVDEDLLDSAIMTVVTDLSARVTQQEFDAKVDDELRSMGAWTPDTST